MPVITLRLDDDILGRIDQLAAEMDRKRGGQIVALLRLALGVPVTKGTRAAHPHPKTHPEHATPHPDCTDCGAPANDECPHGFESRKFCITMKGGCQ